MLDNRIWMQCLFAETGSNPLCRKRDALAEGLASVERGKRLAAESQLEMEGENAGNLLREIVGRDVSLYRSGKRWLQGIALAIAAIFLLLLHQAAFHPGGSREAVSYLIIPAWLALPFVIALYDGHQVRKRRLKNTILLLYRYHAARSLGALIELMESGDAALSSLSVAGLALLLPQCGSDAGLRLTKKQRLYLYRGLIGYNSTKALTVLAVLEQFGEADAIPYAQRMTEYPHWSADYGRVRSRAAQCLGVLRARAATRQAAHTLLRPASLSEVSAETLLRPADCGGVTAPQELLRTCEKMGRLSGP